MAIQNYSRPQSVIRQIFAITPQLESDRINAVVIGPNYFLNRYTNEEELADTPGEAFAVAGQNLAYANRPVGSSIDLSYAKVFGEELDAELAEFEADVQGILLTGATLDITDTDAFGIVDSTVTYPAVGGSGTGATISVEVAGGTIISATVVAGGTGYQIGDVIQTDDGGGIGVFGGYNLEAEDFEIIGTSVFKISDLQTPNKIKLFNSADPDRGVVATPSTVLDARFVGRDVQVGDIVKIEDPRGTRSRVVTAIENLLTVPSFGSDDDRENGQAEGVSTNPKNQGADNVVTQSVPVGWNIDFSSEAFVDTIQGPNYNGKYGDLFVVTCTRPGGHIGGAAAEAEFSVRSNSGFYAADQLEVNLVSDEYQFDDESVFQGLSFTMVPPVGSGDPALFELNQQFIFIAQAKYNVLDMTGGVSDRHLTVGGTYSGSKDTVYSLQVSEGSENDTFSGATIKIFDSTGVDQVSTISNITAGVDFNLGSLGLTFRFDDLFGSGENPVSQGGLKGQDIYSVKVSAAKAEAAAAIVVLNGSAVDITGLVSSEYTLDKVSFFKRFSGEITPERDTPPTLAFEATQSWVTVGANLKLFVSGRTPGQEWVPFEDGQGELFAHYRALVPPSINDQFIKISLVQDIIDAWGKIDQENHMAYGAFICFAGSQGKPIFGAAVSSDTPDGYSLVLREASNRDDLYAFAPLTLDKTVQDVFKAHVEAMSTEFKKQWRRVYVATEAVAEFGKITDKPDDTAFNATVTEDVSGGNIRVISEDANFSTANINPGDLFRTSYTVDAFNNESYAEYVVAIVLNQEELLLESGPATPILLAQKFEIWGADTGANQASRVAAISESFGSRRVTNIFVDGPETLIGDAFVPQPVYFVAAELAGLRSAILPQQGLTFTEVESVSRAIPMFAKYTQEELDQAAAGGTFIITQEVKDSPVFIRHQLTTETDKGLLFYEDNVGVNADEISYATKDFVQPFIGRRNATAETVAALRTGWENLLLARTKAPAFQRIGSQIIRITDGSLEVFVDAKFKDRVNMKVNLEIPIPLNRVEVDISFTTSLS